MLSFDTLSILWLWEMVSTPVDLEQHRIGLIEWLDLDCRLPISATAR